MSEEKRCTKCVLPDTHEAISFDENGVCNYCREFEPFKPFGEEALIEKLKEVKGDEYDCIAPVSGGRDSTYVMYALKVKYGKNPLAVHFDNGFTHPLARENLRNSCRELGIDLIIEKSPFGISRKITSNLVKSSIPYGPKEVLNHVCTQCSHGATGAVQRIAKRKGIEYIITGSSHPEDVTIDWSAFPKIPKKKKIVSSGGFNMVCGLGWYLAQRSLLHVPGDRWLSTRKPLIPGIDSGKVFSLFDYIEWDRNLIRDTIEKELGWKKPEGSATSWRYDCKITPFVDYLCKRGTGVEKKVDGFSTMIRYGKMTREEALEQIRNSDDGEMTPELEQMLREDLKLTDEEIEMVKNF